jgi:thiol-disulfide isomerase/thioredoxin
MRRFGTILFALLLAGVANAAEPSEMKLGEFIPQTPPQPAPEISFTDIGGNTLTLGDFSRKLVIVNLWATWCQPCIKEMPSLTALQAKFGDRLALLAISQDRGGAKVVQPFIEKLGLEGLKPYLDPKSTVGHAFAVRGLPTTIVIDAESMVRGRVEGAAEWEAAKMLAIIEPLLPDAKGKTDATPIKGASATMSGGR